MSASPASPDSSDAPEAADDAPAPRRSWLRRVGRVLGLAGAGLLLLLAVGLLVLQTDSGATALARYVAGAANPLPGTTLSIDRASGSWLRSLRLTGVTLTRTDSTTGAAVEMARVDTLSARYRLLPLLQGRLHLTDVSADGPAVTMRQAADSSWDWARVLPAGAEEDTSAGMPVQIDRVAVTDGAVQSQFYAEGRDSTAHVQDLRVRARDLHTAPSVTGRLDTLGLQARLPTDTTDLRLAARGRLEPAVLQLDTLQFDSPRSRVRGGGRLGIPASPDSSVNDVDLRLRTDPFVLADLTPLVPTLDVSPEEALTLDLRVTGSGRALTATANGSVSTGGTLSATATATPSADSTGDTPLQYRLDAEVDRLTTSLLGPPDSSLNRLSASAEADLRGPSLTALDGTAALRVRDTRWGDYTVADASLTSTVEEGTAELDAQSTINGATLQATGQMRPFDAAPSAALTLRTQGLDVAALAPDAGVESDLSATAEVEGSNLGGPDMSLDAQLELAPSRLNTQRLTGGTLSIALRPEQARLNGRLALPEGRLATAGSLERDGSEAFALEYLRMEEVDLAALAGDTTDSRINGTLRANGRGFTPEALQLDASADLADAHYGAHRLSTLSATARLADGDLRAETDFVLNESTWSLAATGQPFADPLALALTEGRFRNVDLGPFLQDSTQSSDLNGTVEGRLAGTEPSSLRLDAAMTLDSSRVNRQSLDGAETQVRLRDGTLTSDGTLETPQGRGEWAATARPFDAEPSYELTEGQFENLNAGALAGVPGLRTALSGGLTLEGRGADPSSLSLDAGIALSESSINDAVLSEGQLSIGVADGGASADGAFSLADGHVQLKGRGDSLATTPTYTARAAAGGLDVAALAGNDSLTARLDTLQWTLDGRGTDPDSLAATTQLTAEGARWDQFRVHTLDAGGTLEDGRLALDTLGIDSNVLDGQGRGALALTDTTASSSLALDATVTNLQPLQRLVGAQRLRLQEATLKARLYGTAVDQRFDGALELEGLTYDDFQLAEADVDLNGARDTDQLQQLEVDGTLGYASLPALSVERTRLRASYDGSQADVSSTFQLDSSHRADLRASVTPEADQTTVTLSRLDLRMGPDQWALAQEATLTAGDQYRVENFRLRSDDQRLSADGVVDTGGDQDLSVTAQDVRLGEVSPLFGFSGLGGTLSGEMDLTGPATAPVLDGGLALDLRSNDEPVGTMQLDVGYDSLAVGLDATLTHTDGSRLTATGSLPADLRLDATSPVDVGQRPVQLALSTDRFPVNWVDPFLDPETVRDVRGSVAADVTVGGTLNDPDLQGTASLENGGAYLPALGTPYRNAQAALSFADDQVTLDQAAVQSGNSGRLRASGVVNFPQLTVGTFDLDLNASNFLAIDTRAYRRALIDGSMELQGTTQEPELNGTVEVQSADVSFTEATAAGESAATVALSSDDQLTLENRFGIRTTASDTTTYDAYDALAMDLTVRIRRDTWLRSQSTPEMNIQFTGDLDLNKAPRKDPEVYGTIEVVEGRSTLQQFGQEFQISEGTLTFNGDPYTPYLNLAALYEQRARGSQESEVRITLTLEGRPDDLTPTLASEPPMDTRNILSYLATGRPADELFSGGSSGSGEGGGGGNLGTQVLLGQATNLVENLAANELGMDVVRLQIRTSGTSYLTLGRYFTPRFFVSIEQPVSTSSLNGSQSAAYLPDLTMEYNLTDALLLRALSTQNSFQVDFLFEYAY
ncbi:MAG: translocation/assembly module TamB domain-containing protein [Salinivenus sp.]